MNTRFKDKNGKELKVGSIIKFHWYEDSCWGYAGNHEAKIVKVNGKLKVEYIDIDQGRDGLKEFYKWTGQEDIEVV